MRKVYCDLCGNEFDDSVMLKSDQIHMKSSGTISIKFEVPKHIDICNDCRQKILDTAIKESEKIKKQSENGKNETEDKTKCVHCGKLMDGGRITSKGAFCSKECYEKEKI
jgi:hypothetical protein